MSIRIMPGEVTPTLFVGLGGSGGKAVGRIAKRLRAHEDFEHQYRGLIRFLAIDTNDADLARLRKGTGEFGRVDDTVLISDFDKVAYSDHRRGQKFADADDYFTQWVHEWYRFRKESGAGAGQIRIESRLSFYRSVEVGDLGQKLASILDEMRSHSHGMRHTGAPLQIFVYFSVAGGTGSGAFLPFAYLCRDVAEDPSTRLVGFAILPEAFENVVGQNREGTFANGYAALKELEHLMKLDTQASSSPKELEFHYDPRNKHRRTVQRRPYDLVYVVDRPQSFSLEDVGAAMADATYLQIFSPILGDQQADFDNYTKESRRLFPDSLFERGEGYTAFYGTLGSAVLVLPKHDLLEYCARRYAATAVRRYLLLDDPALVSESQREQFKRFSVDRAELERLAPDAQRRRVDESFLAKVRLLGAQDQDDGPWKRALGLPALAAEKVTAAIAGIEDQLRDEAASIREISADRILDGSWTPAATINSLKRQVAEAREAVAAIATGLKDNIETGEWWGKFLATAGPDGAAELGPYEQRLVLIHLRETGGAPLTPAALDALAAQVARLRGEADLGNDSRFKGEMDALAAELKRTYGGWDKLLTRKDKDFDDARDRTVATFNDYVDKVRAGVIKGALHEVLVALGRAADALRESYRAIEGSAGQLAAELEEKARRYEWDGGVDGLRSEANEYTLDVEILQHPSARNRFWGWYYADQIEGRPELSDPQALLGAVRESMRPRFDERGQVVRRTAREIVGEIVESLVATARRMLTPEIVGDPQHADPQVRLGLRLDDALALEAAYYGRYGEARGADPAEMLRDRPLRASTLWRDDRVRLYARRKLEAALAKAQPLSRYNPEVKGSIKHPNMLLVGLHESLQQGPLREALTEATAGADGAEIEWPVAHRIVLYRSILGVPIYCFPHVNDDMKESYRRFQAREDKAWPLHIDRNWEGLPDLDPEDRRRELEALEAQRRLSVVAFALGLQRKVIERGEDGYVLRVREDRTLPLADTVVAAADALIAMGERYATVADKLVTPLMNDARRIDRDSALFDLLKEAVKAFTYRCEDLELQGKRSAAEEHEYQDLRVAQRILGALSR
ncbi:MAG: hypothetical protein H6711_23620 [Myxococcales bacterium]|nr:hypothetical protein [Myxococcales bacterium]